MMTFLLDRFSPLEGGAVIVCDENLCSIVLCCDGQTESETNVMRMRRMNETHTHTDGSSVFFCEIFL